MAHFWDKGRSAVAEVRTEQASCGPVAPRYSDFWIGEK